MSAMTETQAGPRCSACRGALAPLGDGDSSCVRCGLVQRPLTSGGAKAELLAAAGVFGRPFTLSELVLAAWARAPELFGLPGEENWHPSDSRVRGMLYGTRGLVARGLVRRLPDGRYEVVR